MKRFRSFSHRLFERAYGTNAYTHLSVVLANDFLTTDQLEQLQLIKLRALLKTCWERSPFYNHQMRKADLYPDDVRRLTDLTKFPTVAKTDIRRALEQGELLTRSSKNLMKGQTGGSTGQPLVFYYSKRYRGCSLAYLMRAWHWWGWRPGDRRVTVWGRHMNVPWTLKSIKDRMIGLSFLEADKLSNANAIKYLRVIDRVKPAILEGYVSSLVEIVRIGSKLGIRVQPPGAVVTTAETLFPHDRRVLSDYFETEIFDDYGSSEVESIAFECPTHSGMHVAADHVILETGDDGRVILTDLDNHAMPFVRYENGDAAEWTRRSCPCGRSSPLLARVLGRQSERVIGPNGNRVHDVFFAHLLEDYGWIERYGVEQFQVVQESLDLFLFRLIVLRQPRINDERILTNIMRRFLGDIRVQYEYPTAIPPSAAGKRQSVISHLSPRQS